MAKNGIIKLDAVTAELKRAPATPQAPPKGWAALTADQRIAMVRWRVEQMCGVVFGEWDTQTQTMFREFAEYFRQSKRKWLLLIGNIGTGKTTLAKAIVNVYNSLTAKQDEKMMILNAVTLADYYRRDSVDDIIRIRKRPKILIDDIGTESESLNVYGNTVYPFADFVLNKYDDPLSIVLLTTNLNSAEIASRYGERVLDRIVEKCFVVKNEGKSLRH